MLDYKTCIALKEAGYPQKKEGNLWAKGKGINGVLPSVITVGFPDYFLEDEKLKTHGENYPDTVVCIPFLEEYIYIPTLSELIEACGEEFDSVSKAQKWRGQQKNKATGPGWVSWGKTPEEAVANLLIKLLHG